MGFDSISRELSWQIDSCEAGLWLGWSRLDAPEIPVPAQINGVPHPFHCRSQHFFSFQDELRGAVAIIEEPGHIYEGLWVIFSTRVIGTHNFVNNLPFCDIQVGADSPVGEMARVCFWH